ncbi:MAG: NUDIX hydrolase [bacterium]
MKKFNNKPNKVYNINDKLIWESRSVAVNCLVILSLKNNLYILSEKRGSGSPDNVGKWCFPCGYLDFDETATDAAIREVYEETSLDLYKYVDTSFMLLNNLNQPWYVDSIPNDSKQNVTLRFATVIRDVIFPDLSDEHSEENEIDELKWISFTDIGNYDWAFRHDEIIKEFITKYELI